MGRALGDLNDNLVISNVKRTGWQDSTLKTPGRIRVAWSNHLPNMAALIGAGNKEVGSRLGFKPKAAYHSSLLADRSAHAVDSGCRIVAASRQEDGVGMVDTGAVAVGPVSTHSNDADYNIVKVPENILWPSAAKAEI